ncbi:hypothetical protein DFQ28_004179 [Apophysomyces sp. BC1034]|nr:hypothetical protein DFQ29_004650 [Apophysomyces sp. BC1021]KAG0188901.1 hypothetical protein DFQ28_004179 [Apophysomyces sp. BC1034]
MAMLPARSKQLQKRADQLKTTKLQYLSQIDDIRRVEQERDQAIVAKVAPLYIKPESPEPTPVSSASLRTTASTSTATVSVATASVVKKVSTKTKKKKKIKVREVEIGDESSPGWELKPSLSQQDLTYNKHP